MEQTVGFYLFINSARWNCMSVALIERGKLGYDRAECIAWKSFMRGFVQWGWE